MCGEGWKTCNSLDSLLSEEYTVGKVLAHGFGSDAQAPDYSYLKGDITRAYTRKVKEAKRSFVFLNLKSETVPAALIVYSSDKRLSSELQVFQPSPHIRCPPSLVANRVFPPPP